MIYSDKLFDGLKNNNDIKTNDKIISMQGNSSKNVTLKPYVTLNLVNLVNLKIVF